MFNSDYWQHKLSVYLHDPPHKCVSIPKHEQWAQEVADLLGCSIASKDHYQNADMIASGLTRAAVPSYHANSNKNGAVDFIETPAITHPVVAENALTFDLASGITPEQVHKDVLAILADDMSAMAMPLDAEERAKRFFYYLFFALKKRLRNENAGKLGAAWDMLPADTRIPDHPIWHHIALTSAVASSLREDPTHNVSLAVFTITPVQQFIAKARKLRDHWCGSVVLSYLAFIGLRHISEKLGPDHVVYPSLHDQSLVEGWLGKSYDLEKHLKENELFLQELLASGRTIASFPNKFVFIAPPESVEEICISTREAINTEWLRIAVLVRNFIGKNGEMAKLFDHQVSDYWHYSFAAAQLPTLADVTRLEPLLHRDNWINEAETVKTFAAAYGDTSKLAARIYAATHSLIQGVLASAKLKPSRIRKPQVGEKCPLCGEHEVLHDIEFPESRSAKEYSDTVKRFWDALRDRFNSEGSSSEVGKNERLCAVCCVKRFLPRTLTQQGLRNELLYDVVSDLDNFPATTEIAAHNYLEDMMKTVGIPTHKRNGLIDALHDSQSDTGLDDDALTDIKSIVNAGKKAGVTFTNRDKYYAVLLMDGDKMGDLINGETVTATWGDVVHPVLRKRYDDPDFTPENHVLRDCLIKKRTLNPALHAAISDSLNSFARFGVAPLVAKSHGRLIYAGGDDVCAILPLDSALETADAIRQAYTAGFVRYTETGVTSCGRTSNTSGKLGVHFGKAPGISISAAIVIAHHKEPLKEVLKDAHALLDGVAKKKAGRNAVAIRLKKRSGGDRDFYCKWDDQNPFVENETILDSFRQVANGVGSELSMSLLYRLDSLKNGIEPMKNELATHKEHITKLFGYEINHSGLSATVRPEDAGRLAGITLALADGDIRRDKNGAVAVDWFNPEAAIIAGFLGRRVKK